MMTSVLTLFNKFYLIALAVLVSIVLVYVYHFKPLNELRKIKTDSIETKGKADIFELNQTLTFEIKKGILHEDIPNAVGVHVINIDEL